MRNCLIYALFPSPFPHPSPSLSLSPPLSPAQVVNDGEMTMWRALGVSSWPTLALIGPDGRLIGMLAGEGNKQVGL